jgi:hypothetical protein
MSRPRRPGVAGWLLPLVAVGFVAAEPPSPGQRARFFDLEVTGRRVAFVCDRSGSMSEPQGRPLAVAMEELLASLAALGDSQQFHLFFYNDRVTVFTPPGGRGRPQFADEETLRSVGRFVSGMTANGGTQHAEALAAALAVAPDEVFLLTDGELRDDLSAAELERLTARLGRTRLHVVQFSGGGAGRSPRLARLAATSGGGYRVVDPVAPR